MTETEKPKASASRLPSDAVRRHLLLGWAGLLVFIALGVVLEGLHAFKVPFYLDVQNESRRFFFRLAHAHGALLSLVQLGVAGTLAWLRSQGALANERLLSTCFASSLVLLPGGFFFAGWGAASGDPGFGILLVPGGAVFLLAGTFLLVRALRAAP